MTTRGRPQVSDRRLSVSVSMPSSLLNRMDSELNLYNANHPDAQLSRSAWLQEIMVAACEHLSQLNGTAAPQQHAPVGFTPSGMLDRMPSVVSTPSTTGEPPVPNAIPVESLPEPGPMPSFARPGAVSPRYEPPAAPRGLYKYTDIEAREIGLTDPEREAAIRKRGWVAPAPE